MRGKRQRYGQPAGLQIDGADLSLLRHASARFRILEIIERRHDVALVGITAHWVSPAIWWTMAGSTRPVACNSTEVGERGPDDAPRSGTTRASCAASERSARLPTLVSMVRRHP